MKKLKEKTSRSSISNRIMMALVVVVVFWGILLSLLLQNALTRVLSKEGLPPEAIGQIANSFTVICSSLTLIGILIFFFIARYFAQLVTEPVNALMKGVETLAQGEFNSRVEILSNDEFGELAAAFNRMASVFEEFDRMKSDFVSTVSHELRTPLTSILGYAELLESDQFTEEKKKEFAAVIVEKAEWLARTVEELLDVSRIEAGHGLPLKTSSFSLQEVILNVVMAYRQSATNHTIIVDLPSHTINVTADRVRMERVFENIFSNAIKYSPKGGTIRVSGKLIESGDDVRLSVSDEGIGMTPEQVAHVFDKFYRANASDTGLSGFGLGMSIVKTIVEAHGGKVWLESKEGFGTTVHLRIPLTPP